MRGHDKIIIWHTKIRVHCHQLVPNWCPGEKVKQPPLGTPPPKDANTLWAIEHVCCIAIEQDKHVKQTVFVIIQPPAQREEQKMLMPSHANEPPDCPAPLGDVRGVNLVLVPRNGENQERPRTGTTPPLQCSRHELSKLLYGLHRDKLGKSPTCRQQDQKQAGQCPYRHSAVCKHHVMHHNRNRLPSNGRSVLDLENLACD